MRKNIFTKIAAVAAATVLAVTALPALVSDTHAADDEYSYVYAGLTWQEYWANEGVYNAGDVTTSNEKDTKGEYDKGAFDTVTRATTNHGLLTILDNSVMLLKISKIRCLNLNRNILNTSYFIRRKLPVHGNN